MSIYQATLDQFRMHESYEEELFCLMNAQKVCPILISQPMLVKMSTFSIRYISNRDFVSFAFQQQHCIIISNTL